MFQKKRTYTEEELVSGCAANDRRAQEALYRRFFPEMLRMCRKYARDEDIAIEMVNNGFLRVFKKIHLFEHRGSLEGWIRRLVYHCMADYYRRHAKYLHFLILDDHDQSVPANGLDHFFEEDILKAVRTLPPISQEVFKLYAIEGYSHAEIADTLKMSEGTSKWHLSTARQKLRDMLEIDGDLKLVSSGL
ncbi:MAG: sigma-70 family RNA polymerase sigma factor [Saprospiraceae bacterium]|nr:sigma-70 family RNA polymerase sigma factor [Saprospiraceae bacterium]